MIGFEISNLIVFFMECSCMAPLTPVVMGLLSKALTTSSLSFGRFIIVRSLN